MAEADDPEHTPPYDILRAVFLKSGVKAHWTGERWLFYKVKNGNVTPEPTLVQGDTNGGSESSVHHT